MRLRAGIAAVGILLAGGSLSIVSGADAQVPAGPRFGENYLLPALSGSHARDVPGLAVDPADQSHIVEAENDPINLQCDYHVSFDRGRTWTGGHLTVRNSGESPPFPTPACSQNYDSGGYAHFNTGVVFGSGQNVYITFSAHRGPFNRPESNLDGGAGDDAVVAQSTDGGRTFKPAVVAIPGGGPVAANPGLAGYGMRPQVAVQRGAGSGGQDRLYVASWNCYIRIRASQTSRGGCSGGGGDRRIFVARSDDGGTTWTTPVLASAANVRTGAAIAEAGSPDEQTREPSQPVIGPDGAVYVAYRNRDITSGTTCPTNPAITSPAPGGLDASKAHCIVVARSTNQGQSWQQFATLPVATGTLSNPRLAIDPATPAGVGTLYVVFERQVTGDPVDITLQKSTDRAQTWSSPVRVNDDPAGVIQTNPWVSVGSGGRVDVIWGDRRHSYPGGGSQADIYYAGSTNGGTSFAPGRRVTDRTINLDVGRYHDLGSEFSPGFSWYGPVTLPLADGSVLSAWADSREGNIDTGFQDIYLSRLDPAAPIERKRIATATTPGLSVVLSRLAYPGGPESLGSSAGGGDPVTKVVVANQGDIAGALAGAVLARAGWAPLLLSQAGGLPATVKAEATRMKPEGAYVIGDTSSLSTAVSRDLRDTTRDGENVVRVSSPQSVTAANRPAEIARRIAELIRPLPGNSPEAVIANPGTPQAASASALAAALKLPILFVDNRGGASPIPPPTEAAISSLGIKKALIVGGTGAVNAAVETRLGTLLGAGNVRRLGGANQYETSEAALTEAGTRGLPANVVYVADGDRPVDAAVLGASVGRLGGLMLLRPSADLASAESRLGALPGGVAALVDRLVAAVGTGGTDPAVAAAPGAPPGAGSVLVPLGLAGCPPARAARNVLALTSGNDRRNGTRLGDLIFAGAGDDVIDGLGGDDCIDLGPGRDRGQGGAGDDFVVGGLGNDVVSGSSGRDALRGDSGNDRLTGGTGGDRILGGTGLDRIFGGFGDDSLHGQAGGDRISGSRGRDRINGGAGADRIDGSSGADRINGDSGGDRITGGSGRDRIRGNSGRDRISARDGQRDRIDCGSGRDRVTADRIDRVARNCERVRRR